MSVRDQWGMVCPNCKDDDNLRVQVVVTEFALLTSHGTDLDGGDQEWDDASPCRCENCGWEGKAGACKVDDDGNHVAATAPTPPLMANGREITRDANGFGVPGPVVTASPVRAMTVEDLGIEVPRPSNLTADQEDAVIAAMRLWQNVQDGRMTLAFADGRPAGLGYFDEIATCNGKHAALTIDEIDRLLDDGFAVV